MKKVYGYNFNNELYLIIEGEKNIEKFEGMKDFGWYKEKELPEVIGFTNIEKVNQNGSDYTLESGETIYISSFNSAITSGYSRVYRFIKGSMKSLKNYELLGVVKNV